MLLALLVGVQLVGYEDGEVEAQQRHQQQIIHVADTRQQTEEKRC